MYTLPGFEGEDIELSINPKMFWEVIKCMIRGKTISHSSYLKKKNQSLEIEYEKKLHTLQLSYESIPSEALGNKIKQTEDDLKMFREKKVNAIMVLWQGQKLDGQQKGENVQIISVIWKSDILMKKIKTKIIEENGEEIK
jgi:hypothetical protein